MQANVVSIPPEAFHAFPVEEVLPKVRSQPTGLSSEEAERRLRQDGRNELPAAPPRHPIWRLLAQFHNALIYFLLAGAVAAWLLGHYLDAGVIVAVVLVNATVGFIQEGKAENALAAIRRMISPHAHVLRDGERVSVPVAELVKGDLVLLEAGDRVPADIRLLRARGMLIEEAILTGESLASEKHEAPVPVGAALGDRSSMAFSGTMVASGQGAGVVVATGQATEIGHVSRLLGEVQQLTTPLLRQINDFGRWFTWIAIFAAALLFAFAVLVRSYQWDEALIAVVALAVGVVPEGLPAVITITLAIGVQRMAKRNAIVRRLPAVETLGATSVICSDKTGTLTRNEMTARRIVVAHGEILVSGAGYEPKGELTTTASGPDDAAGRQAATALARAALLCNDAHLHERSSGWTVNGDPMEGALVTLAIKAGLDATNVRTTWPRLEEIPFDAQHRFMATLHRPPDNDSNIIFVKGAPERVLEMCASQDCGHHTEADVETGLVFLGIVGFIDPPRPEAVDAVAECHSAGIRVKMITGDHAATAAAIARQLGLGEAPRVLTGHDLDTLSDADLRKAVSDTAVFARTSPEHKLRVVRALQADGHIVAMTGDGVNDAPALKQADVGIAMGHKGTEAAKEASEMVLLDDNFASIVAAVHEGRTVYDNIQKVTSWTLPTNGGEVLTVIAAILFGFAMPMTPAHILWINMILTITLGLVLAFDPPEAKVMSRPPRKADAGLLSPFLVWRVVFVSLLFVAGALGIFFYALGRGSSLDLARTMVVNTIVVLEIFYLFNVRYLHMTSFTWRGALGTPPVLLAIAVVVIAQFAFTYTPIMQELFTTEPVSFADGVLIVAVGIVVMIVLEAEKHLMRRLDILKV